MISSSSGSSTWASPGFGPLKPVIFQKAFSPLGEDSVCSSLASSSTFTTGLGFGKARPTILASGLRAATFSCWKNWTSWSLDLKSGGFVIAGIA